MPAPAVQPRSTARPAASLSRQDLLGLGRSGRPREFLPIAVRAIQQVPDDLDLRFLLAAACAQLGLRTIAAETLAALPEPAQADANVKALTSAVGGLPDDRVSAEHRRTLAAANLGVLRDRGIDAAAVLEDAWPAWLESMRGSMPILAKANSHLLSSSGPNTRSRSACSSVFGFGGSRSSGFIAGSSLLSFSVLLPALISACRTLTLYP